MAENGRKWFFAWCTPWTPRQPGSQVENGRKWVKKVHRGYMVGNGFRIVPVIPLLLLIVHYRVFLETALTVLNVHYFPL